MCHSLRHAIPDGVDLSRPIYLLTSIIVHQAKHSNTISVEATPCAI